MFESRRCALSLLMFPAFAAADPIAIPNYSFELPPVTRDGLNPFGALPYINDWDETAVGPADEFDQNTGNFINTDPGSPDHITNPDADRLAFISSLIGNAIRQNLTATYQIGRGYTFTVAIGKSFTFPVEADEQLQIALFYVNGGSEQIISSTMVSGSDVGSATVTDFSVALPDVSPGDPWAGQPIGVMVRPSLTDPDDDEGEGFWNVDFARLEETSHAGTCPGAGDCCSAHANAGCTDFDCCDAVCFVDSFCCEDTWDADCASFAALFCPSLCQSQPDCGSGDCCSPGTTGCSDATCCGLVCLLDNSCCTGWNALCAEIARQSCEVCQPAFDCPQSGECCQAHLGAGCERLGCCQTVCQIDATCCTDNWGLGCARTARENCVNVCDCATFSDFDANGRIDLRDFAAFQRCFSGESSLPVPAGCACADYDADGDADLVDLARMNLESP